MRCYTNDAGGDAERVVALGTFDGVHLGHQAVLEVAQTIAMCEGSRWWGRVRRRC